MVIIAGNKSVHIDRLFYVLNEGYRLPDDVVEAADEQIRLAYYTERDTVIKGFFGKVLNLIREYKVRNKRVLQMHIADLERNLRMYKDAGMKSLTEYCQQKLGVAKRRLNNFDKDADLNGED